MIVGVDTDGNSFVTLTQSNSNSNIMQIYFLALVKKLDKLKPSWRDKTIILLDGASYHHHLTHPSNGIFSLDIGLKK